MYFFMKQNIENASISWVSSICQGFIRKTMLGYFMSSRKELTNHSLKSSDFCVGGNPTESLGQGCQTHFYWGPHLPRGCLQRVEIILGLYKCNYSLTVKELKLHSAL